MSKKLKNRVPEKQLINVFNFKPKNERQAELIELIEEREIVIATGIAGSGKTFCALATALGLLGETYKSIILVKSVTTLPGEDIGYTPGTFQQKMEPFLMSYTWNIDKLLGKDAAKDLIHKELIQILPLAYIRGLSIDNAIVIIDETQNIDYDTLVAIITRIGTDSKYIFLGDTEQIDRKKKEESCLKLILELFKDDDIVGTIEFSDDECVRNRIIPLILQKLRTLKLK